MNGVAGAVELEVVEDGGGAVEPEVVVVVDGGGAVEVVGAVLLMTKLRVLFNAGATVVYVLVTLPMKFAF